MDSKDRSTISPVVFFLLEMIGATMLAAVVGISSYHGWRTFGALFYGLVYYALLSSLQAFSLHYTNNDDEGEAKDFTLTPRFNPLLTAAHFLIAPGGTYPRYENSFRMVLFIVLGSTAFTVAGALIGGSVLTWLIKKPGGIALDDVYKFGTSYIVHNGSTPRPTTIESFDHFYAEGAGMEFVGICVLAYAFTVDDKEGTDAVDVDKHKPGAFLGKPIAVGLAATLVAYTMADYTGGICNPAISFGIYAFHDIEAFKPHGWSTASVLLYLFVAVLLFVHAIGYSDKAKNIKRGYLPFVGLFLLTILILQSSGDLTLDKKRPERWTTVGPIYYGIAVSTLVWIAQYVGCRNEFFHPLVNLAVSLVEVIHEGIGKEKSRAKEGLHGMYRIVMVVIRDALAVLAGVLFYYFVSPMKDGHPHASHFVAQGFASYDTDAFRKKLSMPNATEAEALETALTKGLSAGYLYAPEVLGVFMLLSALPVDFSEKHHDAQHSRISIMYGATSALVVYLFGDVTTGTVNAWITAFLLAASGNISEFWTLHVGVVHLVGIITAIVVILVWMVFRLKEVSRYEYITVVGAILAYVEKTDQRYKSVSTDDGTTNGIKL